MGSNVRNATKCVLINTIAIVITTVLNCMDFIYSTEFEEVKILCWQLWGYFRQTEPITILKSFDIAPNISYTILFIVNCNKCLSAEFIGQASVPYKRIGKHFYLVNSNNTSSLHGATLPTRNRPCTSITNALFAKIRTQQSHRAVAAAAGRNSDVEFTHNQLSERSTRPCKIL